MDTREILLKISEAGTPIAFLAKNINKDPSTISKWMRGSSKYLSKQTEEELISEIRRIKQLWEEIEI